MKTTLAVLALLSPGTAQFALVFEPGSTLTFPHNDRMKIADATTIEAWVKADKADTVERNLFTRYIPGSVHKGLGIGVQGDISYIYTGSPWSHNQRTKPGVFPFDGRWHHVAFCRHANAHYEIYVDGKAVLRSGPGPCFGSNCKATTGSTTTYLGTTPKGTEPLCLASLRISTTDRYSADFVPEQRWKSDPQTAMLLLFQEGAGNSTKDSGPAGQIGTFSGPIRWEPQGSFRSVGLGCGSTTSTPRLASPDRPRIGGDFHIHLSDLQPGSVGALIIGHSTTSWHGTPLPLALAPLGLPGCQLYVSMDVSIPMLTGGGSTEFGFKIPDDASLIQLEFGSQAWAVDRAANWLGLQTTNGGIGVIGR